ncbi:MAG: HNH endonuclease [Nitrospiraceae bacterium]
MEGQTWLDRQSNGIPLCPNCHRVFDEILRPLFYRAITGFGGIPKSWGKTI